MAAAALKLWGHCGWGYHMASRLQAALAALTCNVTVGALEAAVCWWLARYFGGSAVVEPSRL